MPDLPITTRENYEVDEHGFLQRSLLGKRKWLQTKALSFRLLNNPRVSINEKLTEAPWLVPAEVAHGDGIPDYPSPPSSKRDTCSPENVGADETCRAASRDNYLELVREVLTEDDTNTLNGRRWLNDTMINFGLYVLGRKHAAKRVFFYNTFLIQQLRQQKPCAKWTTRPNPAAYDYIIVPIHDPVRKHWLGAVLWRSTCDATAVHADSFELTILDSLGGSSGHDVYRAALKSYLSPIRIRVQHRKRFE
ncbi:hypothetical protein SCUCBS95973_006537 [Sporothrix curviconia]|uniref:Ubiquitin-like protease family profile domain-containing protein n=1 Tax=Sporothrix curviconia TaxID=1260050 RepID=A0ABP0C603_9PEZI